MFSWAPKLKDACVVLYGRLGSGLLILDRTSFALGLFGRGIFTK